MESKHPRQSSRGRSSRGRNNYFSSNSNNIESPNRVPILNWASNITKNNFHEWKEKLIVYASMNYRFMHNILETNEDVEITAIAAPAGAKLSDTEKIEYQSKLNIYTSDVAALMSEKLPFFTFMIEHISEKIQKLFSCEVTHIQQS
jgi:hypothetical protein